MKDRQRRAQETRAKIVAAAEKRISEKGFDAVQIIDITNEAGITGVYQTPQGYYVDDADVEEFAKGFPTKEKLKLPGQIFG